MLLVVVENPSHIEFELIAMQLKMQIDFLLLSLAANVVRENGQLIDMVGMVSSVMMTGFCWLMMN